MKPGLPFLLLTCLLLGSGCAGYQLGSSNGQRSGSQSLQFLPIANETVEARLVAPMTTALRRRVQEDGTFRLVTNEPGDVLLHCRITDYQRRELSVQSSDVTTARDYLLQVTVHATATERLTGRLLLDRTVTGRTTVNVGTDLTSTERQAIPLVAEDLARNLVGLVADGDF